LLKNKLELFIAKRVLIFFVILAILDMVFINQRFTAFAGLALGTILGLLRLAFMGATFSRLLLPMQNPISVRKSIARNITSQAVTAVILFASIKISIWFFIGTSIGIVLVPTVVFINSITEGLGITHNNFE